MPDYRDDVSKYRTLVSGTHDNYTGTHNVDEKIGRKDSRDIVVTSDITASGIAQLLPLSPLGRRNYIRIQNLGAVTVEVKSSTTVSGVQVASGEAWEENTDATFYIQTAGSESLVRVYERSTR